MKNNIRILILIAILFSSFVGLGLVNVSNDVVIAKTQVSIGYERFSTTAIGTKGYETTIYTVPQFVKDNNDKFDFTWKKTGKTYKSGNNLYVVEVIGTRVSISDIFGMIKRSDKALTEKAINSRSAAIWDPVVYIGTTKYTADNIEPTMLGNKLTWKYGPVTRTVELLPGQFKELYTLTSKPLGNIKIEQNLIKYGDFNNYVIEPYAYDKIGRNIEVTKDSYDNKYVEIKDDFIYPIYIDPTTTYYFTSTTSQGYLDFNYTTAHNAPSYNAASAGHLFIGQFYEPIYGSYLTYRSVIQFDTSLLPVGANIDSAELGFVVEGPPNCATTASIVWCPAMTLPINGTMYGYMHNAITDGGSVTYSTTPNMVLHIDLNAYGLGKLIPGGTTVLGLRTTDDIAGTAPTTSTVTYTDIYNDNVNTLLNPTLKVTYSLTPSITTKPASNIGKSSATLNSLVTYDGGVSCYVRYKYGMAPGVYTTTTNWVGGYTTGLNAPLDIINLVASTPYYFMAQVNNTYGVRDGSELSFTTTAGFYAASNLTAMPHVGYVDVNWIKGVGAYQTLVLRKHGSYPINNSDSDAYQAYLGTSSSFTDISAAGHYLIQGQSYFYRAWSKDGAGNYSATYVEDIATIPVGIPVLPNPLDIQQPGGLFVVPTPNKILNIPFYGIFSKVATNTGIPEGNLFLLISAVVAAGLGAFIIIKTGNKLIGMMVVCICLIAATSMGVAPLWIAIYTIITLFFGSYVLSRG